MRYASLRSGNFVCMWITPLSIHPSITVVGRSSLLFPWYHFSCYFISCVKQICARTESTMQNNRIDGRGKASFTANCNSQPPCLLASSFNDGGRQAIPRPKPGHPALFVPVKCLDERER